MQLLLKRYKRKINKVIKGGNILSILFFLMISLIIPPFNIYANSQNTIIVPTWDSSTTQSQWDTHLTVENYCEGTNASTNSCKLMFTVDSNYYGYIYFDGYVGNTKWIDFQMVFIADGYGEYNYNLWSNGQISINKVNIAIVNLVQPNSSVDLTQIIQLLTAIEQDTSSIDILVNQTKTQIINVLNQLVISNGYLETLTKLRKYDFSIESYSFINQFYLYGYDIVDNFGYSYYSYPLFYVPINSKIYSNWSNGSSSYNQMLIFGVNRNITSINSLQNYFDLYNINIINFNFIYRKDLPVNNYFTIVKIEYNISDSNNGTSGYFNFKDNYKIIPIYHEYYSSYFKNYISTDFALTYGLTNDLLNNLNIIAQGTNQSNQSSSSLETQKGSFDTTSNNLYSSENAFNTDMNSKLQSIDTSFNPSTSFGSKFLSSADWVRTQFNNLTSTTPFGTVLSFSMLLGLSLLIIGKVFK